MSSAPRTDDSDRPRRLRALFLSLVATVGVFLAAEAAVRLIGIEPAELPLDAKHFFFRGVRVDPVLGWLLRPGWHGNWLLSEFDVQADERGFRSTGHSSPAAPSCRVAFLGDSCSFGWGMSTPDTFVAQLDDLQRAKGEPTCDLMNAAFPGQSAVVGAHILRERVLRYRPDVVVIAFSAHNAFRFALVSDIDRLRFAPVRKLVLRSRLLSVIAAWWANHSTPAVNPRQPAVVVSRPLADLRRVADAGEYDAALRTMVDEARAHNATPLFLLLPRRCMVSADDAEEDAAMVASQLTARQQDGGSAAPAEVHALETSCLDHRTIDDPVGALYERRDTWHAVYPQDPELRDALRDGARAFVAGDYARATQSFIAALERQPDSPLARYDLGVVKLASGDQTGGMRELEEADRLACSAFLHYNVLAWRVARDLAVPVVDITLYFQAHDGEPLFLDPAHPNRAGHVIIAGALQAALERDGRPTNEPSSAPGARRTPR